MLKLATALVAVLLFLSPALAKTKPTAPAPAPAVTKVCTPPDVVLKDVGERLLKRLDGDEAKKFVADKLAPISGGELPAGIETVFVLKAGGKKVIFVIFVKGCYSGLGVGETKDFPDLFDDGSI